MSETNTQTPAGEREPAPAAQPEYVPTESLSAEDNEDATKPLQQPQPREQPADKAEDKPAAEPAAETEEERRDREKRSTASRVGYLTKKRYEAEARAQAAEQRARELELRQNGGDPQQQPMTPEQFEQLIEQRVAHRIAMDQDRAQFREFDQKGQKEFGEERFLEACNTVAGMAADPQQRSILRAVAMDTEGGAKAIMEMAGDAELAERILALPPHRMALEVAKLGAPKAAAPKPVSSAPPPIRPPAVGRARGEPDPENGSMEDFMRWSREKASWRR